jgi:hypothetical protein
LRTFGNTGDAVSSAFPKGKQLGRFFNFLDITGNEFHEIAQKDHKERLLLLLRTFCHVFYATIG